MSPGVDPPALPGVGSRRAGKGWKIHGDTSESMEEIRESLEEIPESLQEMRANQQDISEFLQEIHANP
jgi:methyl-accepting chemotaxis protein